MAEAAIARINYRDLAQHGQSPVTCKECRYCHGGKIRGRRHPITKRVVSEFDSVGRCKKLYLKPKEGLDHPPRSKKDFIPNPNRSRYTDEDYACGYGLPVPRTKKK